MNALEQKGIKDNTLVFFLQDNGGCAEGFGIGSNTIIPYHKGVMPDEVKPMAPEELQTRMVPTHTRDGKPLMAGKGLQPGGPDTYLSYGKAWANASNTPFRMYKHWVHEGGIASPLIVHWPAGIAARNEFRDHPSHIIDIMATCVDVGEARYPEVFRDHEITKLEGLSLTPAFRDETIQERPLFWEHEGNKAVRLGNYKLVSRFKKGSEYNWELYDLVKDRSETHDLLETMTEKAAELEGLWKDWAKKAGVLTWGNMEVID